MRTARIQNLSVGQEYLYFLPNFQPFQGFLCIHQILLGPPLMSSMMTATSLIPTDYNKRQQLASDSDNIMGTTTISHLTVVLGDNQFCVTVGTMKNIMLLLTPCK